VRALARASRQLERASDELSLAHYRVLSAIAAGDQRASRIAQRLTLGKPTISATVEALRQRGLLARSAAEGDQRVSDLHLTSKGEELLGRVETAMVARITELCDKTPDGHQLLESLAWMGTAIDHSAIERPTAGSR
jgi:DNA-binding MarR family transcriptional regulator